MKNVRGILIAAAVMALVACGRGKEDDDTEFVESTPDSQGLALEIMGGAAEGVDEAGLEGSSQKQGLGADSIEYLKNARDAVRYLNAAVKQVLAPIAELVNSEQAKNAENGTVKIYGPKDRGTATYRFAIKKVEDGKFTWKL